MKKYGIIAVCLCIVIVCSVVLLQRARHRLSSYYPKDTVLYDVDIEDVTELSSEDVLQFHIAISLLEPSLHGMILIEYEKDNKEEIVQQIDSYVNQLASTHEQPAILQTKQVYADEQYYVCCFGNDAKTWLQDIKERVIK